MGRPCGLGLGLKPLLADPDETEEERKRREARQNGDLLGAVAGTVIGAVIGVSSEEGGGEEEPVYDPFPKLTM